MRSEEIPQPSTRCALGHSTKTTRSSTTSSFDRSQMNMQLRGIPLLLPLVCFRMPNGVVSENPAAQSSFGSNFVSDTETRALKRPWGRRGLHVGHCCTHPALSHPRPLRPASPASLPKPAEMLSRGLKRSCPSDWPRFPVSIVVAHRRYFADSQASIVNRAVSAQNLSCAVVVDVSGFWLEANTKSASRPANSVRRSIRTLGKENSEADPPPSWLAS